MAERDSAAMRRRDRRLRMHWRHEQLTLRVALAAALHHSRDVVPVTYNALRSPKTGGGERDALRHGPDDSSSQSCSRQVLPIDASCGGGACSQQGGGRHLSSRCGRRTGFCGAPWSRTSTPSRSRPSMFLRRRRWTNRWRCSCLLTFLPSR